MKRIVFVLFCLCGLVESKAQIAKWLIPPSYEKIQLVNGIEAIMTDSLGTKAIWTMEGKKLISTKDELYSFKEGIALSVKPGTSTISKVYKQDGEAVDLGKCYVARDYPYFSNGKLLVWQDNYYKFVDANGKTLGGQYANAYPYFNGYAVCETYLNMEKQKDLCRLLLDDKGKAVSFSYQGKGFDVDDLQFISSVNDEHTGIVVIKNRLYYFNGIDRELSPIFADGNSSHNLKEQAKVLSDIRLGLLQNADSTYTLMAKCGKKDTVTILFDVMKRPMSVRSGAVEHVFKRNPEIKKTYDSNLRIKKEGDLVGLYGANMEMEEMLPPQFDEVITCLGDKALVRIGGKAGMLEVMKDENFKLRMNKGDDIAFRHQKYETSVRVDFPTFLRASKVNIEVDPKTGCEIDKTSKDGRDTEAGNFVEYKCVLNIPENLPDELTTVKYPMTVYYDGFRSSEIPFSVEAWHCKYFVVDIDDSQTALDSGTVSFVFNINAERIASDGIYPTKVEILTDSLHYEYEKMSETRYKCKVFSLKEGVNNIVVQVLEQGCPPAVFPFEVEYYKPVAKTKDKPEEKEKVTIKKKEKESKAARPKKEEKDGPRVYM